jgi:heme a synthase
VAYSVRLPISEVQHPAAKQRLLGSGARFNSLCMIDRMSDELKVPVSRAVAARPWVGLWLKIVAFMIFVMVLVGGATRLTNSGLSITEWQPLLGAIPPLNAADWQLAFDKYRETSQFKLQNPDMALGSFQFIYWWEWSHRFLGRFIGLVFLLPFLVFAVTRRLEKRIWPRLLFLFVVGGLQGALGWYMVASGLVDRVEVSQYRLAAHLTLAVGLFAAMIWVIASLRHKHEFPRNFDSWTALILLVLVFVQIAAGGFVAGLDAGQGYNTWPKMDGLWIPNGLYVAEPLWRNLFENALTVQFDHRMLAYWIFIVAVFHALKSFSVSAMMLAYAVFAQACLGILTLLMHVPLAIALIHQAGAIIVVMAAVWNLHKKTISSQV